jgi:CDP-diacylglycerol--serine O-phosphatidyltransferase
MPRSRRFRRGIYLLPTLFTIGNMFCGYTSVVRSSAGNLEVAAALIVVAAVLDGLDGRIARLTGTQSEFGVQFDSLADIVSFGMAPAFLAYHWALQPSRMGGSIAFLFLVCASMRLARFNIRKSVTDSRYFAGLPSPMAGIVVATIVYAFPEPTDSRWVAGAFAGLVIAVALAMISRLRYRSFRELDLRNRRSYVYALPMAAVLIAIAIHPKAVLLALGSAYLLSGPALYLWGLVRPGGSPGPRPAVEGRAAGNEVADESAIR